MNKVMGIGVGRKSARFLICRAGLSAACSCTVHLVSADFKARRMNLSLFLTYLQSFFDWGLDSSVLGIPLM